MPADNNYILQEDQGYENICKGQGMHLDPDLPPKAARMYSLCLYWSVSLKIALLAETNCDKLFRLKWNWVYIILASSLETIASSSPLGTLHQFLTDPNAEDVKKAQLDHLVSTNPVTNRNLV